VLVVADVNEMELCSWQPCLPCSNTFIEVLSTNTTNTPLRLHIGPVDPEVITSHGSPHQSSPSHSSTAFLFTYLLWFSLLLLQRHRLFRSLSWKKYSLCLQNPRESLSVIENVRKQEEQERYNKVRRRRKYVV